MLPDINFAFDLFRICYCEAFFVMKMIKKEILWLVVNNNCTDNCFALFLIVIILILIDKSKSIAPSLTAP